MVGAVTVSFLVWSATKQGRLSTTVQASRRAKLRLRMIYSARCGGPTARPRGPCALVGFNDSLNAVTAGFIEHAPTRRRAIGGVQLTVTRYKNYEPKNILGKGVVPL